MEEEILYNINRYLMNRFNYKMPYGFLNPNSTISFYTRKVDIYLRLWNYNDGFWKKHTLVVSRIGFKEERKGHGSHFITFLTDLAKKYKYDHIGIECVNNNSRAFALKLGFKEYGSDKNYIISTNRLKKILIKKVI